MIKRRLLQKMDLVTEMFKVHKNMLTELVQGLFCVRQTYYNLRNCHHFAIPRVNSVYDGSESISNLALRIWNLVPDKLKYLIVSAPSKVN